jgi:hypothetical protein
MMINPFKFLFPIVISSLLMLLTGCNSEGGFSPHSPDAAPKEVAEGSALVDIKGNSVNNQAFPVGVPVRLTFSVAFTDGSTYSTDDDTTDSKVRNLNDSLPERSRHNYLRMSR